MITSRRGERRGEESMPLLTAEDQDLIAVVKEHLRTFTGAESDERVLEFIDACFEDRCTSCGRKLVRENDKCHCWNDE